MYKHPWNISRKFEKESSSRTGDIIDTLISVRKWGNEQTDRKTKNLKLFKTNIQHPWNISRKFENDSSSKIGDITDNLFLVRKWGDVKTDRHTKNQKLFETSVQISPECLQKILERLLIQSWRYHWYTNFNKEVRPWIDKQEIWIYVELICKHPKIIFSKI